MSTTPDGPARPGDVPDPPTPDVRLTAAALDRSPGGAPRRVGRAAAFAVFAVAGLLFVTSATTAEGGQLRSESGDLATLVLDEQARVQARTARVAALTAEVDRLSAAVADPTTREKQAEAAALAPAARIDAADGPGVVVTLNDAPIEQQASSGRDVEDLIVHQQDLQAVVNALWAGGATNIALMGQQIISTSAVRCVGNTVRLQGRLYSPPYVVTAVGDPEVLEAALDASRGVTAYKSYQKYGLGYDLDVTDDAVVPAYTGSLELQHARVAD